jgi:cytochrome c-type biogenesis protein CcmH/NrfG
VRKAPDAGIDLEPVLVETPPEPELAAPLALAQPSLDAGGPDAAARQYESQLARGDVQAELIAELEQAVQAHPRHSGLQRVLGDAYMQSNQLEQALEAYREALRKL